MKTLKSVLPVVLLLAAIAALPLTRGVRLPSAFPALVQAPAVRAQASDLTPPAPWPDQCAYNDLEPDRCVTGGNITVAYDPAATCTPDDPAWGAATPTGFYVRQAWESYLYPQHVEAAPNLSGEELKRRPIKVAALRNDSDICFRMTWTDATKDEFVDDLTRYADGVAIMIPFGAEGIAGLDYQNNVCIDSFHM